MKEIYLFGILIDTSNSSVVYTRWGKTTCPSNAELVHSGKEMYNDPFTEKKREKETKCVNEERV